MDIDAKKSEEKKLFDDWEKRDPSIIPDGVVSWCNYANSAIKILFVLKEVNSDERNWDLREFLKDGGGSYTWNNITRWIIGIRNINIDYDWSTIENIEPEQRREYLDTVAAINLKKATGGKAVADNDIICKHALNDSDLLKRQVDIYEPDLIICCGTSDAFFKSIYKDIKVDWRMTHNGVWYVIDGKRTIIDYKHPEARVFANFLYYPLMDALREISKEHNNGILVI